MRTFCRPKPPVAWGASAHEMVRAQASLAYPCPIASLRIQ
jgi:hypothetical protein